MDLSALIFLAVVLAWAAYLIPMWLKRSEELSARRPVEVFSDSIRVLRRNPEVVSKQAPSTPVPAASTSVPATPAVTRESARKAAQRRRRVLYILVLATAITAGVAGFAVIPWWSVAIPAGLVVAFLVIARLTVRRENARWAANTAAPKTPSAETSAETADEELTEEIDLRPTADSVGMDALAEEGALWDPLPLTLPTYVGKAHVRRTVRTIDLTGMNSSGHDEADSKLAKEADEARTAERAAAADAESDRKVAGA